MNGGSPAEKAGLQAGDAVIKVNDVELFNLRHKDAQDAIVRAGNNFEFTVQRYVGSNSSSLHKLYMFSTKPVLLFNSAAVT